MPALPALAAEPAPPRSRVAPLAERVDEGAFTRFYDDVAPRLWAYLVSQTGDRAVAEELAQEAWSRVLASKLEPESDEHLRRYLFRTAIHLLRDRGRGATRAPLPLVDELDLALDAPPVGVRRDLVRALAALRPKERRLIWLAHVEELDHRAIADLVGARAASVRVMLHRARRRLAELLDRDTLDRRER